MVANKLGLIATLALAGAPNGAPASSPPEASAMSIELAITGAAEDVPWAAALERRARETFATSGAGRFVITLEPKSPEVVVWIADDTGLTTTRTFSAAEAEASAWLFVRSTIERSLRERQDAAVVPRRPPAQPPAPVQVEVRGPNIVPKGDSPAHPRFMALARLGGGAPSAGAGLGLQYGMSERLLLDADLGYARTLNRRQLELHEVLFGLGLAATWGSSPSLVCGLRAEGQAKIASVSGRSRTALGAAGGPFFESQLRVRGVTLLLRAGLLGRLVRQRYQLDGTEIAEAVWLANIAVGVGW